MLDPRIDAILALARAGCMTDRSIECVRLAVSFADQLDDSRVDSRHVLAGLYRQGNGVAFLVLRQLELDEANLETALSQSRKGQVGDTSNDDLGACMSAAADFSVRLNHSFCGTEHLLAGTVANGVQSATLLAELGISSVSVEHEILGLLGRLPNGPGRRITNKDLTSRVSVS